MKIFIRAVASLLEKYLPDTYSCDEVQHTEQFGPLPVIKSKGEGGRSDLPIRIGDNYYNQYLRYLFSIVTLHLYSKSILSEIVAL